MALKYGRKHVLEDVQLLKTLGEERKRVSPMRAVNVIRVIRALLLPSFFLFFFQYMDSFSTQIRTRVESEYRRCHSLSMNDDDDSQVVAGSEPNSSQHPKGTNTRDERDLKILYGPLISPLFPTK